MFWLKIVVAALTVAFSTALGHFLAGKYRARRLFFSEFARFNERYLSELSYERRRLSAFLREMPYEGEFEKSLAEFREKREASFPFSFLSKEERAEAQRYFQQLGRGDARTQSAFFSAQSARLNALREQSAREAKARGELYLKLGLLAGLALVVLIL